MLPFHPQLKSLQDFNFNLNIKNTQQLEGDSQATLLHSIQFHSKSRSDAESGEEKGKVNQPGMAHSMRRLALVLMLAFSAVAVESTDYICTLAHESLPLVRKATGLTVANGKMCLLCEQYSTEALRYLQQNETQTEILSVLHHSCAHLGPLRQQCITLVDYYIPFLFLEVSGVNPEQFCESVHLCPKGKTIRLPTQGDTCGLCHHVVVEVLIMLKDPNMKLEIVGLLLKTCSKAENYAPQCKRLVLEYIPLILVKTQKYLETTDVCSAMHACKAGAQATMETMPLSASS